MEQCLALLRKADDVLMTAGELTVAVHLARAIDELEEKATRLGQPGRSGARAWGGLQAG